MIHPLPEPYPPAALSPSPLSHRRPTLSLPSHTVAPLQIHRPSLSSDRRPSSPIPSAATHAPAAHAAPPTAGTWRKAGRAADLSPRRVRPAAMVVASRNGGNTEVLLPGGQCSSPHWQRAGMLYPSSDPPQLPSSNPSTLLFRSTAVRDETGVRRSTSPSAEQRTCRPKGSALRDAAARGRLRPSATTPPPPPSQRGHFAGVAKVQALFLRAFMWEELFLLLICFVVFSWNTC